MREININIPECYPDPVVYFKGTDAEIAAAEKVDQANINAWKNIITDPEFCGLQFGRPEKYYIVTPSIYDGVDLQLSYFDDRGPIMHENYYHDKIDKLVFQLHLLSKRGATVNALYS